MSLKMIQIHHCDEVRRKFCLHRLKMEVEGFKGFCTSDSDVLLGCPMLQKEAGCFHHEPCDNFNSKQSSVVGGKTFIEAATCSHHPDRFPVRKSKRSKLASQGLSEQPQEVGPAPMEDTWVDDPFDDHPN